MASRTSSLLPKDLGGIWVNCGDGTTFWKIRFIQRKWTWGALQRYRHTIFLAGFVLILPKIYRCWTLWNFNWKVVVFPIILLLTNTGMGMRRSQCPNDTDTCHSCWLRCVWHLPFNWADRVDIQFTHHTMDQNLICTRCCLECDDNMPPDLPNMGNSQRFGELQAWKLQLNSYRPHLDWFSSTPASIWNYSPGSLRRRTQCSVHHARMHHSSRGTLVTRCLSSLTHRLVLLQAITFNAITIRLKLHSAAMEVIPLPNNHARKVGGTQPMSKKFQVSVIRECDEEHIHSFKNASWTTKISRAHESYRVCFTYITYKSHLNKHYLRFTLPVRLPPLFHSLATTTTRVPAFSCPLAKVSVNACGAFSIPSTSVSWLRSFPCAIKAGTTSKNLPMYWGIRSGTIKPRMLMHFFIIKYAFYASLAVSNKHVSEWT